MSHPLPERADVVVIGGGLIGTSVAYQLARRGVSEVLLLERGEVGAQGATANCLGGWRTQFATEINVRFSLISKAVFDNFEALFEADPNFIKCGYLYLASQERSRLILEGTARLLRSLNLEVELLDPAEVSRRWPYLRVDDLAGACWTAGDGIYGPNEVVQGYARGGRRLGAAIRERAEVVEILTQGGRVRGVKTAEGQTVRTDFVVNAAGPWAGQVAALAGLDLPVGPLRRHVFCTDAFNLVPAVIPFVLHFEKGWYTRREGASLLLSGPADNSERQRTFSEKVDFDAEEWAAVESIQRVPALEKARIARGWIGHYALSPDHHAVIGAFPELAGFICVTGFSGHGFQHSPAAGMVTAELITDGRASSIDIEPLRPSRFREGALIEEPLTSFRH